MMPGGFFKKLSPFIPVLLLVCSCPNTEVKWAARKGDLRDLPVMAASGNAAGPDGLVVKRLLLEESQIAQALASGETDAAYMNAVEAMTRIANQNIKAEILAVTYRNAEGKPERLLLAQAAWVEKNPKGPDKVLAAHRAGINRLVDNPSLALELALELAPDAEIDRKKFAGDRRWESGMDIAGLIDVLDGLRLSGKISPARADELAARLVRHESLLEKW